MRVQQTPDVLRPSTIRPRANAIPRRLLQKVQGMEQDSRWCGAPKPLTCPPPKYAESTRLSSSPQQTSSTKWTLKRSNMEPKPRLRRNVWCRAPWRQLAPNLHGPPKNRSATLQRKPVCCSARSMALVDTRSSNVSATLPALLQRRQLRRQLQASKPRRRLSWLQKSHRKRQRTSRRKSCCHKSKLQTEQQKRNRQPQQSRRQKLH